jgi:hypothetical protein
LKGVTDPQQSVFDFKPRQKYGKYHRIIPPEIF